MNGRRIEKEEGKGGAEVASRRDCADFGRRGWRQKRPAARNRVSSNRGPADKFGVIRAEVGADRGAYFLPFFSGRDSTAARRISPRLTFCFLATFTRAALSEAGRRTEI